MPLFGSNKRDEEKDEKEKEWFVKDITKPDDIEKGRTDVIFGFKGEPTHGHTVIEPDERKEEDVVYNRDPDGTVNQDNRTEQK